MVLLGVRVRSVPLKSIDKHCSRSGTAACQCGGVCFSIFHNYSPVPEIPQVPNGSQNDSIMTTDLRIAAANIGGTT